LIPKPLRPAGPLIEYSYPRSLSQAALDRYLRQGWFRTGQGLFRFQVLYIEGQVYSVVNVRLPLRSYEPGKALRRLLRRNRQRFRLEWGPAESGGEREDLFQQMKGRFKGFLAPTLQEFLSNGREGSIFGTRELRVYEGSRLVAVSFFDEGKESAAGLLGLYSPDYASSSLGLYTMLEEVCRARDEGKKFYYPGYILKNYPQFDYKLRLGPMQFMPPQGGHWQPLDRLEQSLFPAEALQIAQLEAMQALSEAGLPCRLRPYPFFALGHIFCDDDFVKTPLLLSCDLGSLELLVEYHPESGTYSLSRSCRDPEALELLGFEDWLFSEAFFGHFDETPAMLCHELRLAEQIHLPELPLAVWKAVLSSSGIQETA
jgi:arginine-tRNA-protein transferase